MKDLTGQRFGRLTVIAFYEKRKSPCGNTKYMWECQCDCGNHIIVNADNLKSGHVKSCKCLRKETSTDRIVQQGRFNIKHGLAGTKIYYAWHSMLERCYNRATAIFVIMEREALLFVMNGEMIFRLFTNGQCKMAMISKLKD